MLDYGLMTQQLVRLVEKSGYPLIQKKGQRKFGPPRNWTGSPPERGCEVFVGKLPRDCYEDELVPVFEQVGTIYELRLMMDFSGSNRGYAFVTFSNSAEARRAIIELNNYEIRPRRHIGVVKSVDNCRLFLGGVPKEMTKEEVKSELDKYVSGISQVIMYSNCMHRRYNRGFAFIEFESHQLATMARRTLIPGRARLWGHDLLVDWAEPEPFVDTDLMQQVKVLYVRNLQLTTSPEQIQTFFEELVPCELEKVKKIKDFAFVHFQNRRDAEAAMAAAGTGCQVDGVDVEVTWAKPVDRAIYKLQKAMKYAKKMGSPISDQYLCSSMSGSVTPNSFTPRQFTPCPFTPTFNSTPVSSSPDSSGFMSMSTPSTGLSLLASTLDPAYPALPKIEALAQRWRMGSQMVGGWLWPQTTQLGSSPQVPLVNTQIADGSRWNSPGWYNLPLPMVQPFPVAPMFRAAAN